MITYAMITNKGSRSVNEDSVGIHETSYGNFFVLADGLGGHGQGEVASALAVESILKLSDTPVVKEMNFLEIAITEAQKQILEEQKRQGLKGDLKTTVTLLSVDQNQAKFAHVGDSRIYMFEKEKVVFRTLDHSVPQMLVNQGIIREKDIRNHEDRNRLIRVLGNEEGVLKIESTGPLATGKKTSFLLCSDGFWELICEKEMCQLLKNAKTPQEWLGMMETVVCKNGLGKNMDNYSAIAVFVRL